MLPIRSTFSFPDGRWVCILALCGACDKGTPATQRDSASTASGSTTTVAGAPAESSTWPKEIDPALFIEGGSSTEAIVVGESDSDALSQQLQALATSAADITLLGRGGTRMTGHLDPGGARNETDCLAWGLRDLKGEGSSWSVGVAGARAGVVALDSIDVLSPRDSTALVAEVSRLASAVTSPSGPAFQGLRFSAHDVRRFQASTGVQALAAHVIRRVNQEANPQEEQTWFIAERDSGATSGPYRLVFAERTSGLEEQVVTTEVVGAFSLGGRTVLVLARDGEAGVSYSLVERVQGQWRIRWTSRPTTCS